MRHRPGLMTGLIGLLGLSVFVVDACGDSATPKPSTRSKIKVSLPATPELTVKQYEASYADGVSTVYGLIGSAGKLLDTEVTVRGLVSAVELCEIIDQKPLAGAAGAEGAGAQKQVYRCKRQPRAWLVDPQHPKGRFKLMIAGTMESELARLKKGATVTLKGRFVTSSPDGSYFSHGGLLLLP